MRRFVIAGGLLVPGLACAPEVKSVPPPAVVLARLDPGRTPPVVPTRGPEGGWTWSMPSPKDMLTPDLPDSNRLKGAVGVGYTRDRLQLDLGYQLVLLQTVESSAPGYEGLYNGSAHVVSLSIGYRP